LDRLGGRSGELGDQSRDVVVEHQHHQGHQGPDPNHLGDLADPLAKGLAPYGLDQEDADSLREVENGLASFGGELNHMGLSAKAPSRSSLAYANQRRPAEMYEDLFYSCYHVFSNKMPTSSQSRKFTFSSPLLSIDSTIIELCQEAFDWALYRTNKGACKLHVLLNNRNNLPCWAFISDGKMHDVKALPLLDGCEELRRGAIVVADRGYIDFAHFNYWTERGVYFVTRTKQGMAFDTIEDRQVPPPVGRPRAVPEEAPPKSRVLSDKTVVCKTRQSAAKYPGRMRVVRFWDEDERREFEFLTNNFKLAAITICNIYKNRWQIESFFRCIKQNLLVKSFLGTSLNAVKTQLWTALIAVMLLKYLQFLCREGWALSIFIALVRLHLKSYDDLLALIRSLHAAEPPPQPQPVNRLF
jgi:hypothetical protein